MIQHSYSSSFLFEVVVALAMRLRTRLAHCRRSKRYFTSTTSASASATERKVLFAHKYFCHWSRALITFTTNWRRYARGPFLDSRSKKTSINAQNTRLIRPLSTILGVYFESCPLAVAVLLFPACTEIDKSKWLFHSLILIWSKKRNLKLQGRTSYRDGFCTSKPLLEWVASEEVAPLF